jgi:hypothetical protein
MVRLEQWMEKLLLLLSMMLGLLVDIPLSDMTLSVIKSRRTSVMDSSTAVSSSDIRTREK